MNKNYTITRTLGEFSAFSYHVTGPRGGYHKTFHTKRAAVDYIRSKNGRVGVYEILEELKL